MGGAEGGGHLCADSDSNGETDEEGVEWRERIGGIRRDAETRRSVASTMSLKRRARPFTSSTCVECQHKRFLLALLTMVRGQETQIKRDVASLT